MFFRPIFRFESPFLTSLCPDGNECGGNVRSNFAYTGLGNTNTLCSEGDGCRGFVDSIFVDLDRVLATTSPATPACMAIYGPDIDEKEIENSFDGGYDQCGLLYDIQTDSSFAELPFQYAKWVDLKCNQRTRALMCTILRNFLTRYILFIHWVTLSCTAFAVWLLHIIHRHCCIVHRI